MLQVLLLLLCWLLITFLIGMVFMLATHLAINLTEEILKGVTKDEGN